MVIRSRRFTTPNRSVDAGSRALSAIALSPEEKDAQADVLHEQQSQQKSHAFHCEHDATGAQELQRRNSFVTIRPNATSYNSFYEQELEDPPYPL
jgi:hypothetical protein